METVGWIATGFVALLALAAIGFTIWEIPSIMRYLKIRSM